MGMRLAHEGLGMFDTWGRLSYRWRWWILAASLVVTVVAAGWGAGIFGAVSGSGFGDPASESSRAAALVSARFPDDGTDVALIYTGRTTVDDPAYRHQVQAAVRSVPRQYVRHTEDYWTTGSPRFLSSDRRSSLVVLRLAGVDDGARRDAYAAIEDRLGHPPAGLTVRRGGSVAVSADINRRAESDVKRAEAVSFPILLVLLTLLIGGLVAASLPLVVGALAIVGAFAVLHCLALFTQISVFTINIVTMLGLGLAIDYALFLVSRFREELARSTTVEAAVRTTLATAGRTVAFSGLTVALALASLLVYPQVYFRSMGMGGMAAAGIAVLASLTVLPALLAVLGPRVGGGRVRVPRRTPPARHRALLPGGFYRVARAVMRRPSRYALGILAVLLVLAAPILHANFGDIDYRVLPRGTESRIVAEQLKAQFPGESSDPIDAVVSFPVGMTARASAAALRPFVGRLRGVPHVTSATVTANAGSTARVSVLTAVDRQPTQARRVVADVRASAPPVRGTVLVGGNAAELSDLLSTLRSRLVWLALTVLAVTLVALFLSFGSVVLPVKAIVLSVLSLAASCGAIIWIFQGGHLSGLLDFTPTGAVEPTQLVLLLVVAFALSTDYEMFLLSRIREAWDAGGNNEEAVASGLQATAPVVTSAALLLLVVIGSFSASGISFIKMIGIGMVVAIALDASVVRMLLVPATMRLLGPLNWWAPAPLASWWHKHRPHGRPDHPTPTARQEPHVGTRTADHDCALPGHDHAGASAGGGAGGQSDGRIGDPRADVRRLPVRDRAAAAPLR